LVSSNFSGDGTVGTHIDHLDHEHLQGIRALLLPTRDGKFDDTLSTAATIGDEGGVSYTCGTAVEIPKLDLAWRTFRKTIGIREKVGGLSNC
jgi:hypothetical protein